MQSHVSGLRQQGNQVGDRVAHRGGDQVVVVNEEIDLCASPPGAGAQLGRGDVRSGKTPTKVLSKVVDLALGLLGGGEVTGQVLVRDFAKQGAPVVDREDLSFLGRRKSLDLLGVAPKERGFTGGGVAKQEQVRVGAGIQADGGQRGLVDAKQNLGAGLPGHLPNGLEGDLLRQEPKLGGNRAIPCRVHGLDQVGDALTKRGGIAIAIDAGERGEHVVFGGNDSSTRAANGHVHGNLAVDVAVHHVTQA